MCPRAYRELPAGARQRRRVQKIPLERPAERVALSKPGRLTPDIAPQKWSAVCRQQEWYRRETLCLLKEMGRFCCLPVQKNRI